MPIRVLILGPFPRSLSRIDGGVAAAATYLARALIADPRVEVTGVRIGGRAGSAQPAGDLGWPVHDLALGRFSVSTLFRRQVSQFHAMLRDIKPDVVHAQGADISGYLAVKSGCPCVVTIHGILVECARLRSSPIAKFRELAQARITERFVVERAPHIVAISPYVARYYNERLRGIIHEIPNAVAPAFFALRRDPEPGRVLFAGRLSRGKGVLDLLRVFDRGRPAGSRLVLAGSSPEPRFQATLLSEISRLNCQDRIVLAGLLDERSLLQEFSRASVLVLPSYQETAPMVIQQAMASGLPVLATRVGGIPDLIEHDETGLLFDPGDLVALAGLLARLDTETGLARRLAAAARGKAVQDFDSRKIAEATLQAYESAMQAGRK